MATREELKSMLDEMDEDELFAASIYLSKIMSRRTPPVRLDLVSPNWTAQ